MKFYTNNSFKQMQACFGGQATLNYPEKLYLDITQDCNLYCKMCRDSLQITGKTMSFELFARLVDETAPYIKSYSLFNWGEPLIVKDFKERVLYVNSKKREDCSLDISTNGMLLTSDMIDFLFSQKVKVAVSFDGANRETFERIRRGAKFEIVCKNVKQLASVYKNVPLNEAPSIYTSIQKDNQNQLLEIANLAFSLGIRRMGYGLVTSPKEYAVVQTDKLICEIEKLSEFLDKNNMLCDIYPTRVGDYLWWGNGFVHKKEFIVDISCNAPFVSASVAYNGDVFLCCNVGEFVDNVSDKSFKEVWSGAKYVELRNAVNSEKDMPYRCKNCAWFNR